MGTTFHVVPPEKVVQVKETITVVYLTQAVTTRKLEFLTVEVIDAYLTLIMRKGNYVK